MERVRNHKLTELDNDSALGGEGLFDFADDCNTSDVTTDSIDNESNAYTDTNSHQRRSNH